METQRDLTQVIVHVDMDAFYASVELLDNPELKGSPFGVCNDSLLRTMDLNLLSRLGSVFSQPPRMKLASMVFGLECLVRVPSLPTSCHRVISRPFCIAYIAKKLCPELTLLANHFSRYSEMSTKVMDIFRRYDPNMQPAGTDEGYLKYE